MISWKTQNRTCEFLFPTQNVFWLFFSHSPPPIPKSKTADIGIFQIFECSEGELEYEQDVPGKHHQTFSE